MFSNNRAFATTGAAVLVSLAGVLFLAALSASDRTGTGGATASAVTVSGGFTFSPPVQMPKANLSPIFFQQDAEPEIKVDLFGNIYLTAINGVPGGTDLWKSIDKGAHFVYLGQPDGLQDKCTSSPQCAALGGGDDSIDVSTGGYLYVSSLYIGSVTVSTSMDGGTGGTQPGQAWVVNPAATTVPVEDREWVAAYGPQTLNMTFRQAPGTGRLLFSKSTDAGKTFSPPTLLTSANSVEGNLVVDPFNGNLYTSFIPSSATANINLLRSTDGGATWTTKTIYSGPAGSDPGHKFTIMTVDRGGNVYLAFSRSNATDGSYHVYLMSSTDQGDTWSAPSQVDSGTGGTTTAVMPWIVGGSAGVVDITWIGSSGKDPNTAPFDWQVFFAQTTNATAASPTFNQVQVTTNRIHDTNICFNGTGCTGTANRDLLEYYTMALDPEGFANIAFPDSVNNCPAATCKTNAWFAKQTSGPSAYVPPAAPTAATFAANVPMPGPSPGTFGRGPEPGIKVDSHNCIYTTAPGNPYVWTSKDNGATFTAPVNPVADETALTGGDEEILPFPPTASGPDPVYFGDLGISSVHVRKSTDGGKTWAKPGPAGAAGDVAISSDRQWFYGDRVPAATDVTIYEMDHELASEAIRFHALTNDTAWSAPADGITNSELILPPDSTFPNTNPGPVFVDRKTHQVYGVFNASTVRNNAAQPPFGKMPNVWEATGAPPAAAGAPPGPFTNFPVFKGVFDSPTTPAPPAGTQTFGTNASNDFPSGAIDSGGNIYVTWAMNNARTNQYGIWVVSSHDHGKTFYGPFEVSKGSGAALMPWVAAGDDGRIGIVYYSTPANVDPNIVKQKDPTVPWSVIFAQSLNANGREPVFTISQASDHVNHYGVICNLGLLCASGTRTLADYFQVAFGPDGLANIVYADDATSATHPVYARQVSGPVALTAPTSPQCISAVTSPTPTPSPSATSSPSPTATPANVQLLNISGRAAVDTGDNASIAGFIITGERSKRVLLRGLGPSLTVNGAPVSGRLADPYIELHDSSGNLIMTNDNWRSDQQQEIEQTGLPPSDDHEAAIVTTLAPANYTVVLRGTNNTTGVGLAEVYDVTSTTASELGNLSVRANVLTDDNVLIDGLIMRGGTPKRILFRGIGPELNGTVAGALQDPVIELRDSNGGLLSANDNWKDAPNAAEIQSTGLAPKDDRESAILMTLGPANYTSILRGVNRTTGVALGEVYKLDN